MRCTFFCRISWRAWSTSSSGRQEITSLPPKSAIRRATKMWVPDPPGASPRQRRYNRPEVLSRLRRSLALKLILASAIPSALVLLTGLGALVAHSHHLAATNATLAFEELQTGAILGTLLALTFAGMTIALAARHFLLKPIQALTR